MPYKNKEDALAAQRRYYYSHKEKESIRVLKWVRDNPHKVNAVVAKRRAAKLQRTPDWANKDYTGLWYKLAKLEEERTGRKVHVDHIIPLQGEYVSGLHCEHNM